MSFGKWGGKYTKLMGDDYWLGVFSEQVTK